MDPKYTVDFWKETEYWPMLVREAQGNESMKTAKTWYEEMREIGEQESKVEWLCGDVYTGPPQDGVKKEQEPVYFHTDNKSYHMKILGTTRPFTDESLHKLVGKRICAKGIVRLGITFEISEWKEDPKIKEPNQKYIYREDPKDFTEYDVGQKVRHRNRGLAFSQIVGKVDKIQGNLMFVRWQGIKELEVFNLSDTVNLHANLSKI